MVSQHRYHLENGSRKHVCPRCNKKRFVKYIKSDTSEYVDHIFGRCDREVKCKYHMRPGNDGLIRKAHRTFTYSPVYRQTDYIPHETVDRTLNRPNKFVQFLHSVFNEIKVDEAVAKYKIGTSRKWNGATVFWQIDIHERTRTGKVMLYDERGKRVKEPYNHISWAHSALRLKKFNLKQCLFGEHLLTRYPDKVVGIVESEKTAIIASIMLPKFVWLATGGKNGCRWASRETNAVLKARNVVLFPDLGVLEDWSQKSHLLKASSVRVFDLLADYATKHDFDKGLDLADYLIKFGFTDPNVKLESWWIQSTGSEILDALGSLDFLDDLTPIG